MKATVGLSGLAVLGGVWIGIAPFWVGYAPKHGPVFTGPVELSVFMGIVIVIVGLIGLVGYWAGGLTEIERQLSTRAHADASKESLDGRFEAVNGESSAQRLAESVNLTTNAESKGPADDHQAMDSDANLQALVDRVLKDHSLAFDKQS